MKYPFHLIIKPVGDRCNLNCSYCFYKQKSAEGQLMSLPLLERLTQRYIEEQPAGCREVQFVWQGGEPMLAGLEFYQQAVAFQQKYQRPGMVISNAIQTNGTLLNERWLDFLQLHQFQVGISIDGDQPTHDGCRPYYNGQGSHAKVVANLQRLQQRQIHINGLCVVHPGNVQQGVELYRYLVEDLHLTNIQFLPVVGQQTVDPQQWGELLVAVFDRWVSRDLGRVSVQLFDASFARVHQGIETFCVHGHQCGQQLAIERDGSVYSCDHYVEPAHRLGNLQQLNFAEMLGSLQQHQFSQNSCNHDQICGGCEVKGLCQSGCPRHRDASGKNRLCAGYKSFFTHSMPHYYAISECLRRKMDPTLYTRFMPQIQMMIAQQRPAASRA